eukprot:13677696-Alexandrium_andersonii.AAC.1
MPPERPPPSFRRASASTCGLPCLASQRFVFGVASGAALRGAASVRSGLGQRSGPRGRPCRPDLRRARRA